MLTNQCPLQNLRATSPKNADFVALFRTQRSANLLYNCPPFWVSGEDSDMTPAESLGVVGIEVGFLPGARKARL
jgi:hypothetical protein